MSPRPLVVVVSGTSGAGKTSLVVDLAAALTAAGSRVATLRFDDGDDVDDLPDGDVTGWLARGAPPKEWRTTSLEHALEALLSADVPTGPEVVVVEDPFGRGRPPLDREADLALHLQVPPQVALARRLLRDLLPVTGGLDAGGVDAARRHLTRYLAEGDALYAAVEAAARAGADVVLDGVLDRTGGASTALAAVVERLEVHRVQAGPVPAPGAVGRWHRRAARVLPQDPSGAVLLVLCTNPDAAAEPFWLAVGGGVEEAEAAREAAVRELWEETGLVAAAADLVGPVHAETVVFRWGDADVVQRQEYFTVRVPDRRTTTAHLEGAEAASVLAHRWWSVADVAVTDEVVLPGVRRAVAALGPSGPGTGLSAPRRSGR